MSIALAAVVFAIVDGVLFKPLPYDRAQELVLLSGRAEDGGGPLAPADLAYLRQTDAGIRITGFRAVRALRDPARPDVLVWSFAVDESFFDVLGTRPLVGGFTAAHFRDPSPAGSPQPAVITHSWWRNRLASDHAAIGRVIDLVGGPIFVVGVLPADFAFPHYFGRTRPDILVPLVARKAAAGDRWARSLSAIARIPQDVDPVVAKAKLDAALAAKVGEYPPRRARPGPYASIQMQSMRDYLGSAERPFFRAAVAGAALLVLLGCIDVAGLLAARIRDRERELAVRVSLGATRRQLLHLLTSETLLIALGGAALGLVAARPILNVALRMLPESLLLLKVPAIDLRVAIVSIAAAAITMTAVTLIGMLCAVRGSLVPRVATTSTPRLRSWGSALNLATQSALGITLVIVGSLMLASVVTLRAEDPGFDRGLAVLEVLTPGATTPDEQRARHARVLQRIESSPSVTGVATVGVPLLESMFGGSAFALPPGATSIMANDVPVSPTFFDVAGLRIVDGRALTMNDIAAAHPYVVVSENTARAYWPAQRAIGQTLTDSARTVTVVGVVEEARFGSHADTASGEIYMPAAFARDAWAVFLLKTARDPAVVVREVALAVNQDVPGVIVRRADSLETALARSVRVEAFRATLFGSAAVATLMLLGVGVAGLVSMSVARRMREVGIRSALGARGAQLVRMIVIDHLKPIVAGVSVGLIGSWWATALVSRFLYVIDAREPVVWLIAVATLLAVAIATAVIPARRAARVDPMQVLRAE